MGDERTCQIIDQYSYYRYFLKLQIEWFTIKSQSSWTKIIVFRPTNQLLDAIILDWQYVDDFFQHKI